VKYRQCVVRKKSKTMVTWLPVKFAKVGTGIMLKMDSGEWDTGWKVTAVYVGIELDHGTVEKRSQDYRNQRKVSDI